ncbi:MAG: pyridoxal 5'-phosphate synthase glutaminase subunit PdxT [candidate division WOR-3 bacterium]|nr:pyridoxal 5'-phosphate synthase glutaminase subunit PdxT [candidate division WOR-3 bacterium]MCX7948266.1 pyridoxal 5'-phosphate synthase glutaminase subunit PdxT [candidate division WOR-3 bacterium]MDW8151243.1 pyridoxal 5'-phosphate synthase glutaminase subunit PdxT [candidate division WOR-3 bacterium]
MKKIGILAIQGDFEEHKLVLKKLGVDYKFVKEKRDFEDIHGLIIPGGESTTFRKIIRNYSLEEEIIKWRNDKKPTFGTCAGIIIMSSQILNDEEGFGYGFLDIVIERNAYGRQRESFIAEVEYNFNHRAKVAFIRAPIIRKVNKGEAIARLNGRPVGIQDENFIGITFHPEITGDIKLHEYFLKLVNSSG